MIQYFSDTTIIKENISLTDIVMWNQLDTQNHIS